MKLKTRLGTVMLSMILLSICYQAKAWEDVNSDGIVTRMMPPPGRKLVIKPDSTEAEVVTGYPFRDLMDNPNDWNVTRTRLDYFSYPSWILWYCFEAEDLTNYFSQLNNWELNFDLGVMALKDIPDCTTGEQCYNIESTRWNQFNILGADISSLSIDEPYTASDRGNLGQQVKPPMSDLDYAVRETADWLELVQADPIVGDAEICLIESYFWFTRDELIEFIDELEAECESRGIDFIDAFSIDHNWCSWNSAYYWNGLIDIEEYCESNDLAFSYIIWPSRSWDDSYTDQDFYTDVMYQGSLYINTYNGSPDLLDFMAWNYVPRQMVPEYWGVPKPFDEFPFTWGFLEFYDTYLSADRNDLTRSGPSMSLISSTTPNPTTDGATVSYTCSEHTSNVHFLAFDISGRLIRDEHLKETTVGDNTFYWDGRKNSGEFVSPGVYYIQILIEGHSSVSSKLLIVD
ncbi:MAG: hypothetical protein GF388_07370 [Candidatus Aegiribacteria sp.]|nr:hypothetical protein [Candidatus Aegiribacteria sp.]